MNKKILFTIMPIVLCFSSLTACKGGNTPTPEPEPTPTQTEFTVTWKNYDNTILDVEKNVKKNTYVTYKGSTPTKPDDVEFTYTFEGWDHNPTTTPIVSDTTFVAQYTSKIRGGCTYSLNGDGNSYKVTGRQSSEYTDLIILSSVSSKPVTLIDDNAFSSGDNISSITIPDSIISIGSRAFSGTSISSIAIPNSVASIGSYAFSGCLSISSVTMSNSVSSIEEGTFCNCNSLSSVTIPNSVASIKNFAFQDCPSLSSIIIPSSVTSIGDAAFSGCSSSATISVNSGNTKYDSRNNCNAIIETSTNSLIVGCKNTTIPNNVASIAPSAFYCCSSLTSITIPNSVNSIGVGAFASCTSLTTIDLSNLDHVITGNNHMFADCKQLSSIKVPSNLLAQYKAAEYWSNYANYMVGV